jgi:hypothetical protein
VVKPGRILFEVDGVSEEVAKGALQLGLRQTADQNVVRGAPRLGERIFESRLACGWFKLKLMSKTIDFKKSIEGLSLEDLTARIREDEQG